MDVREYRKRFEAELDGAVRDLDGSSTTAQGHAFAAGQSPRRQKRQHPSGDSTWIYP